MLKLCESIIREYNYGDFVRKGKSIDTLYPKFNNRVDDINKNGGVRLYEMLPDDVWHFKVASGTKGGLKYDVWLHFKNMKEMLDKHVRNKKLWKKDESGVNYNELAAEVFNTVDIEEDCSCPNDLYGGFHYIKTRKAAQFGDRENRPPKVKNPRQLGIVCKHGFDVLQTFPFYVVSLGSYLKKYYSKEVTNIENEVKAEKAKIKAGADFLAAKQEEND